MPDVGVLYMIDDVPAAIRFYKTLLGFTVEQDASPAFAAVSRDGVRLLLSGWNRIHRQTSDLEGDMRRLRADGVSFRTDEIVSGPGGGQIIIADPSGNPIELFQPRR